MAMTRYPHDDPREWLNRAGCNFFLAKQKTPRVYLEDLCFNLHEAAQKALKAAVLLEGKPVPSDRNLERLIEAAGPAAAPLREHAAILAPYETGAEYPSTLPPVSEDEYEKAMEAAHQVLEWARAHVGARLAA